MKKTIVFVDYFDILAFDAAKRELEDDSEVYFLYCSKSIKICKANYGKSSLICRMCMHYNKNKLKDFKQDARCHITSLDELMTQEIMNIAMNCKFDYSDTASLKALKYKGIDIGYAAFSTFATVTRNIMPTYNDFFRRYLNEMMRSEVRIIEAELKFVEKIKPDKIIFHNGRHTNLKPIYQIAVQKNIPFVCTEQQWTAAGEATYNDFVNTIPHSSKAVYMKMQERWAAGDENKIKVSEAFFHNKRYGKYAGDTIYTKKQIQGQLPNGFDPSKRNIAIFNSSEDEYYSISKELDDSGIWPNQYTALKAIFSHYKDDNDIHFYLRIHPNLGEVPYKSHTMLYELKYDNVTIFPPYSSESSYALMDSCDTIMVFNSTMGLESAYWNKPVIALNLSYYNYMGIVHVPHTEKELYEMIDNPKLEPLKSEQCLKAAYYLMGGRQEKLKYYPSVKKRYTFGPYVLDVFNQSTLFGSQILMALWLKILRACTQFGIIGKYKQIARNTI